MLTVEDEERHSAGPGSSVCDRSHALWARVQKRVERLNGGRSGLCDRVRASLIEARTESDGLRRRAVVRASFRLPVWIDPEELETGLRSLLGDGCTLELSNAESAYMVERSDPVARALSSAIRGAGGRPRPKRKTGTSDMNVVGPVWRCAISAYGAGDSSLDHTPNEHVHIREYLDSICVLTGAVQRLAHELVGSERDLCAPRA